jgi:SAM-dependent methyltransferase
MPTCPVCGSNAFSSLVSDSQLAEECRLRDGFVRERLEHPASNSELKDLTDFFHQGKAEILVCTLCKLLFRCEHEPPPAETYSEDEYDAASIERVYPRYLDAFHAKERPFRGLLPTGARVLEIGSHYGAFLQTAKEWGWRAEGIDVGKDTSRFARSKGFSVHTREIGECGFETGSFDAVFIWNCFEQIADPKPTLNESQRILKPGGLLVVRTPNGLFYRLCQNSFAAVGLRAGAAEFLIEAMGYNNLLGFPYLYGHSVYTLERVAGPHGFRLEGLLNSELLTLPLPENPEWVKREERTISDEMCLLERSVLRDHEGALIGPWIELWFQRENVC